MIILAAPRIRLIFAWLLAAALTSSCATTYHSITDVSQACDQIAPVGFESYSSCVDQKVGSQFGFDQAAVSALLRSLTVKVEAGELTDSQAREALIVGYRERALPRSTQLTFHTVQQVSNECKRQGHALFNAYALCVQQIVNSQFGFDASKVAEALGRIRNDVAQGTLSAGEAIPAFEDHFYIDQKHLDWGKGLRALGQGLLIAGVVLGTLAVLSALPSDRGSSPESSYVATSKHRISRSSVLGCCSHHGGLAHKQYAGYPVQCADGTLSDRCVFDGHKILRPKASRSRDYRGCCSWHLGICGYSGQSLICCDLTTSPTCRVD